MWKFSKGKFKMLSQTLRKSILEYCLSALFGLSTIKEVQRDSCHSLITCHWAYKMSNVLQTSNLFSISSSYIIWPHFFGYNSDSMEYKTLKFPMLCCSYFINSSQVLVSFHTFLGKCDLNNTVVSASFEKPSYNPVFAIITYTFRTVFVLLG